MCFFFTATFISDIYPLSLHDALPIYFCGGEQAVTGRAVVEKNDVAGLFASQHRAAAKHLFKDIAVADGGTGDRKSTRLNSSHTVISYAVFCLKKKTSSIMYYSPSLSK